MLCSLVTELSKPLTAYFVLVFIHTHPAQTTDHRHVIEISVAITDGHATADTHKEMELVTYAIPNCGFQNELLHWGSSRLNGGNCWSRKEDEKFMEFVDDSLLQFCKRKVCLLKLRVFLTLLDVKVSTRMAGEWIEIDH